MTGSVFSSINAPGNIEEESSRMQALAQAA